MKKIIIGFVFSLACMMPACGQVLALKSNLAADAVASPNLGAELKLGGRISLDVTTHYNPFSSGGTRRFKHWLVQPELRFWRCEPFSGHFVGVHALLGEYNVGDTDLPLGLDLYKGIRS